MNAIKCNAKNFDLVMMGLAKEFIAERRGELNEIIDEAAELALAEVRRNSPVSPKIKGKPRKKPYAKGWVKQGTSGNQRVYNKNKYQLTHLLEDGTDNRATKKGHNRGRVKGDGHISKANQIAIDYIEKKILNK